MSLSQKSTLQEESEREGRGKKVISENTIGSCSFTFEEKKSSLFSQVCHIQDHDLDPKLYEQILDHSPELSLLFSPSSLPPSQAVLKGLDLYRRIWGHARGIGLPLSWQMSFTKQMDTIELHLFPLNCKCFSFQVIAIMTMEIKLNCFSFCIQGKGPKRSV